MSTAAFLLILAILGVNEARQSFRARIPNGLNVPCPPSQEETCQLGVCEGVGHTSCRGGGKRNPFGVDFYNNGLKWDLELCLKDSDGDGVSNGVELGDPCCLFSEEVSDIFPQATYQLGHPGFPDAVPIDAPNADFSYCQGIANDLESRRLSRFTETFQDGEVQLSLDFTVGNYTIPSSRITTYAFPRYNFPSDKEYDIVAIQPLLDPKSAELVHHFVVVACDSVWEGGQGEIAYENEGIGDIYVSQSCFEVVWAWAPGVGSLIAPPNAGFNVGRGTSRTSFMLELHYDNPQLLENVQDNSGVRLYFTEGHRAQQFGALLVGPGVNIPAFPAGEESYYVSTMVPVAPINETIAPGGVEVFASFSHAHIFARKMFTSILSRQDTVDKDSVFHTQDQILEGNFSIFQELFQEKSVRTLGFEPELASVRQDVDIVPTFSFSNQRSIPVSGTTLQNGDYMGVGCIYDSTDAEAPVSGGWGTREEMCIDIIYVYPIEALQVSGFTTTMVTPYDWIGRVVTGIANKDAISLATIGVEPWIDFQSEMSRIDCPASASGMFDDLSTSVSTLGSVCGLTNINNTDFSSDPFVAYFTLIGAFNAMETCSEDCGAYLAASLGCLVERYGEVVNKEEGWQIVHGDFPELETANDIFFLGYWWAIYHNFPQVCDQQLSSYILANLVDEERMVSRIPSV